jgi:hypothetical protein
MICSKALSHSAVALGLLGLFGCSEPDPSEPPITGPAMGIVEVDPHRIPLGEGGKSGQGGSANSGGAGPGTGGSGGRPAIVGKPCEASTDCPNGLSCHTDTDYISHLQCTTSCDSNDTCEAIQAGSFCIGANVCVRECTSDADCDPKTRCGDAGWCERTGPGSGVPYCGGFATPCALLTELTCLSSFGCQDDSQCRGVAESCYSQISSFACNSQDGCFWSSSSDDCSGAARSCSSYSYSSGCDSQEGCYYSASCTGTPQDCEDTPVSLCSAQPGCTLQSD